MAGEGDTTRQGNFLKGFGEQGELNVGTGGPYHPGVSTADI